MAGTAEWRVRVATSAEAAVVQGLLAGAEPVGDEGGRPLPRRTLQTVRQRVYQREWVHDRYLPDLESFGHPYLTFALAQPFLEAAPATSRAWRDLRQNVLLWSSPEFSFGVFASAGGSSLKSLRLALSPPVSRRGEFLLSVDTRAPSLPVYFDFEPAWSRTVGGKALIAYPQPYPGPSPGKEAPLRPSERSAVLRLLGRPFLPGGREPAGARDGGLFARAWERRCLASGTVRRRTFLDPVQVAQWLTGFPTQVAFLHGALRPGRTSERFFHVLLAECHLRPFLYATDGSMVLLGHLARAPGSRPVGGERDGAALAATLPAWLSEIAVVRAPLEWLTTLVNHRYDRPFLDWEDRETARAEASPDSPPVSAALDRSSAPSLESGRRAAR